MSERGMFFRDVAPSVMAFALSGVYTIVDGFFVGNSLGDNGLAAINLGFPIAAFIQAAGTGAGLSGAIRFTILLGQKRENEARACFSSTVLLLALISILLTGGIFAALSPLLRLLGAEGELLRLTADYIWVIALGAVFQAFATGLVPFIRNLGGAGFAMWAMIAGFVTNIGLDYLFVWVYGLGMAGAAWATIAGQAATMLLTVFYLVKKKIGFAVPRGRQLAGFFGAILKVAAAPFGLTFSPQITTILMNRFLLRYGGEQSVAVYGCIAYITAITYLLLQGVGDGSQPLISRFYSEGNLPVMRQMRKLAYLTGGAIAAACMAGFFLLRRDVGILFGASVQTCESVALYLPLYLLALIFLFYVRITTAFLYATEKSVLSYILVYAEPAAILVLLLTLPRLPALGLLGVWLAVPLAQMLTGGVSVFIRLRVDRQIMREAAAGPGCG